MPLQRSKTLHATTKTWRGQINRWTLKKGKELLRSVCTPVPSMGQLLLRPPFGNLLISLEEHTPSLSFCFVECYCRIVSWPAHFRHLLYGSFSGGWGLSLLKGEGNGTPLQYSCLENPMDGGAWWAAVHGVAKSRTWLNDFTFTFHFHALEKEMATHSSVLAWRIPGMGEPGGL